MTYQPKVGDSVRYTVKREGTVVEVLQDGTVRVDAGDYPIKRVTPKPGKVTFEKIEPPLKAGDVVLFDGLARVRKEDGSWIDHSGTVVGQDYVYTGYGEHSNVQFLVRGGKVVA